jgi:hypothetical protein
MSHVKAQRRTQWTHQNFSKILTFVGGLHRGFANFAKDCFSGQMCLTGTSLSNTTATAKTLELIMDVRNPDFECDDKDVDLSSSGTLHDNQHVCRHRDDVDVSSRPSATNRSARCLPTSSTRCVEPTSIITTQEAKHPKQMGGVGIRLPESSVLIRMEEGQTPTNRMDKGRSERGNFNTISCSAFSLPPSDCSTITI